MCSLSFHSSGTWTGEEDLVGRCVHHTDVHSFKSPLWTGYFFNCACSFLIQRLPPGNKLQPSAWVGEEPLLAVPRPGEGGTVLGTWQFLETLSENSPYFSHRTFEPHHHPSVASRSARLLAFPATSLGFSFLCFAKLVTPILLLYSFWNLFAAFFPFDSPHPYGFMSQKKKSFYCYFSRVWRGSTVRCICSICYLHPEAQKTFKLRVKRCYSYYRILNINRSQEISNQIA